MSTVTKAANAHTTVTTGWSTPTACYSTTNDSTYATLVCPKNGTNSGDFGFPAFTTSDIPDGATINSVVFYTTYGLTATATGATVGMQARRNSTATTLGSEITRTAASMADANGTATGCTLTDLRTANELRIRARATKGNSNTAVTAQIDRLYVTVDYTYVENHNGGFGGTGGGVLTEAGSKQARVGAALTGGGVLSPAQSTARNEPSAATGGGVLSWAYEVVSGETHSGSFTATGGGVAAVNHAAAHNGIVTATAGGIATLALRSERLSALAATGGGIAATAQSTARSSGVGATGAGVASLSVTSARQLAAALSGGGVLTETQTTARSGAVQATGGGILTWTGTSETPPETHSGSFVVTGAGVLALGSTTDRHAPFDATASGVFAIDWSGAHALGVTFTGGGVARFRVTGGDATPTTHTGPITATITALHCCGGSIASSETSATIEPLHFEAIVESSADGGSVIALPHPTANLEALP